MTIATAIFAFIGMLPKLWDFFVQWQKDKKEQDFLDYLQKSTEVYNQLKGAKTREELINAAIQIQRLMHG